MTSDDLSADQCRVLSDKIAPMLGYLGRLRQRMLNAGFLPNDPLLLLVCDAQGSMHKLRIDVHYRGVEATRKAADESNK
jgi:hypothetical protein